MFYNIKKFYNPIYYHGENKNNFFEGWYYKTSFKDKNIAFIPGISKNEDKNFSFIQIIDSKNEKAIFKKFDVDQFSFNKDKFLVKIEDNIFSEDRLKIKLDKYNLDLNIGELKPPTKNIIHPGVIVPY